MSDRRKSRPKQIGWQVFRQVGLRCHEMRSGRDIRLVQFESHCASCGAHYTAAATHNNWKKREINRRCDECRFPGLWVDNLAPPVPIASFPLWARPNKDPKRLKASLGRRQHNCELLGNSKRLRIIEPAEAARLVTAANEKIRAISKRPAAPVDTPLTFSFLD